MSWISSRVRAGDPPADSLVRGQLIKILSSEIFARSERLSAFLEFIVEQTLGGHGDRLKEHVIAVEVYGKGLDFEAAADPIVRVDARRLRDRLREYYASAPHDPVVISVPKGSYTARFEIHQTTGPATPDLAPDGVEPRASSLQRFVWIAGAAVVLIGAIAWFVVRNGTPSASAVRLLTVTSFPGSEASPTFSPDGNFVAFSWTGPDFTADADLWVKAVDGDALRRLTDTPSVNEVAPSWSPDGLQIAFVRFESGANRGVHLISALGGSVRKVSDSGSRPTWLPDSQSLVFDDVAAGSRTAVQFVLATGVRRRLTIPPRGFVDVSPKVSPDGRTLAFLRYPANWVSRPGDMTRGGLFVVPMAGGTPMRLDDRASGVGGPEWTPDGREVLYPRWDASGVKLFRVAAAGGSPVPAAGLPPSPYAVSTSRARSGGTFRVALVDARSDSGLRMIDLAPQSGGRLSAWTAFCDSTRLDWPGRFSRDGSRVSFTSDRNGLSEILIANRDGSGLRTLTTFDGGSVGLASWSADGRFLVFDAVDPKNRTDLYIVGADGGPVRRLTDTDEAEVNAEWSRDGRWIYYASDASGRSEIWKIPAAGGSPVQLTKEGGMDPRESPDGKSIYFLERPSGNSFWFATTLKRVSIDGGIASTVLSGLTRGRWDITDTGVAFLTGAAGLAPDPATPDALEFYSFADGRTRRLGEFPFPVTGRGYSPERALTVSPDARWAVVSHMDHWERDIVVADNFR
jgi:Tol biopolymer transport system component